METRKKYFADRITNYWVELNNVNFNAQAKKFNQADYQKYLAEWADVLKFLHGCSTEFAKENLK